MPQIPKPGTYPATKIQEGYRGKADAKAYDRIFGPHVCGACKHWPGAGLTCEARDVPRVMESSSQDACFSAYERAAENKRK